MKRKFKKHLFIAVSIGILISLLPFLSTGQAILPSYFADQPVSGNWNEVTGFTWDANNRMYVWEKGGKVWMVDTTGYVYPTPLVDISDEVGDWRDHGLLGFTLDPDFLRNGYIYLLYLVDRYYLLNYGTGNYDSTQNEYFNATIARCTRFQADSATGFTALVPGSRFVLIGETKQTGIPSTHQSHVTGMLRFGTDSTLLISIGDGASYNYTDAGGGTSYWAQALADSIIRPEENVGAFRSQMIGSYNGKILRIDPLTGNGLSTNPFYDINNPRSPSSRMWAMGFRNPFRFCVRPGTGTADPTAGDPGVLYIGDVGMAAWEELDVVKTSGKNYGWPLLEGMTNNGGYQLSNAENQETTNPLYDTVTCTFQHYRFKDLLKQETLNPNAYWFNPCDSSPSAAITNAHTFMHLRPVIDWGHIAAQSRIPIFNGNNASTIYIDSAASPVTGAGFRGNASVGGTWYTANKYPLQYQNKYYHGDYGGQWIKCFEFDTNNVLTSVMPFADSIGAVVFLQQHPDDGCIYYVKYPDEIRKICYTGIVNNPPVAVAKADTLYGVSPLTVNFDGSLSSDPEGKPLTYFWDYADGATDSIMSPQHTFTAPPGVPTGFWVKLYVTDDSLQTDVDSIYISVNNTPPVVDITSINNGDYYTVNGNTILALQANVTDAEHGPSQLFYKWQTALHHNNHTHPDPVDTNRVTSTTITPDGCNGEVFFFRITLTVTDAAGLSGRDAVDLFPDCNVPSSQLWASDSGFCQSGTVTFSDSVWHFPLSQFWAFPGGIPDTSSLQNPVVNYTTAGSYAVTLITGNINGFDTLTIPDFIHVYDLPAVSIDPVADTICIYASPFTLTGNPAGGTFAGTGIVGNIFDPAVAGLGTYEITYSYTDSNQCNNMDSTQLVVDVCAGMNEQNTSEVIIYPNPAKNKLNLIFSAERKNVDIRILNLQGEKMFSMISGDVKRISFQLPTLAAGIYLLELISEDGIIYRKILIE